MKLLLFIQRFLLGMLTLGFIVSPARAEDDFGERDYILMQDFDSQPGDQPHLSQQSKWSLSLGVGYSFISNYYADIPDFITFLYLYEGLPPPGGGVTFRRKLGPAFSFEGSLDRQVNSWLSVGVMGGLTTVYSAEIGEEEALGVPDGTLPFQFDIHTNLQVIKTLPIIEAGPWLETKVCPIRPYIKGGAGWYEISQATRLGVQGSGVNATQRSDEYIGATLGAGLKATVSKNGIIGIEARYERIFAPGQKIELLTPFLQCAYFF